MISIKSIGIVPIVIISLALEMNCGAMFGGSRQVIKVDSSPYTTFVMKPESPGGTTPTSLSLERKNNYVLTFEKEGYETKQFEIEKHIRGGIVVLDVLFTGLVGVVVDAATGSWYKLSPEFINVTLTKKAGTSLNLPDKIKLYVSFREYDRSIDQFVINSSVPGVKIYVK